MRNDPSNELPEDKRRREIANNLRAYVDAGIAPEFADKLLAVAEALDEFTGKPKQAD
jgi:hypothetical protein